jgi:hypothetical protein
MCLDRCCLFFFEVFGLLDSLKFFSSLDSLKPFCGRFRRSMSNVECSFIGQRKVELQGAGLQGNFCSYKGANILYEICVFLCIYMGKYVCSSRVSNMAARNQNP